MIPKLAKLLAVALAFVLAVAIFALIDSKPARRRADLPHPNGYDDFMRAAQAMVLDSTRLTSTNEFELRSNLVANVAPLQLVRKGLARESRVPWTASTNYLQQHLADLGTLKQIARLLEFEARLAEIERRTNDAVRIHLETIRFGNEAARGGLMIDRLVGVSCETIATAPLEQLAPCLDAPTCRAAVQALQQIDERRESAADVLRWESEWMRQNSDWRQRLIASTPLSPLKKPQQSFIAKVQQQAARERRLMITLATRAYELDKGRPPSDPRDLVPEYLKTVPDTTAPITNRKDSP